MDVYWILTVNNGILVQYGFQAGSLPIVNRYYALPVAYKNTNYWIAYGFIIADIGRCSVSSKITTGFYQTVHVRECNQDWVITIGY